MRFWSFAALTLVLLTFSACAPTVEKVERELNGYGTEDYPFLISSKDDFDCFKSIVANGDDINGKYFALTCDIDLGGETFISVADESQGHAFTGVFDGRGFSISNYSNTPNGRGEASFFGRVDGTVKNLSLKGCVQGDVAASFATQGAGSIINCLSVCDVCASSGASGIVANWDGLLAGVVFEGTVQAPMSYGIAEGGRGRAKNAYCYDLVLGELASFEASGSLGRDNERVVQEALNEAARDWFLQDGIGVHMCLWTVGADGLEISTCVAAFRGGGTQADPFLIESVEDLKVLRYYLDKGYSFAGRCMIQTRDLDFENVELRTFSPNAAAFLGEYCGNGHVIRNIKAQDANAGLFLHFDGEISSLGIDGCDAACNCGLFGSAGSDALISNSYATGKVGENAAILEVMDRGQLANCYIEGLLEPTYSELNSGLDDLVSLFGIHCGSLFTWVDGGEFPVFGSCYKDIYFREERSHWQGSGVEFDPYVIKDLSDLVYLRESVYYNESFWRYWFAQAADIDLSPIIRWRSIGDNQASYGFMGTFNGNGHCILGLKQKDPIRSNNASLFGRVYGTVMNVCLENCEAQGAGGAILAGTVSDTGKLLNNVVVIDVANATDTISLVSNNSGKVLNNLISLHGSGASAIVSEKRVALQDTTGLSERLPIEAMNQIVTGLPDQAIADFNDAVEPMAIMVKQRITNFRIMSIDEGKPSLRTAITAIDPMQISFLWKMACGNPLIILAVAWAVICLVAGCCWLVWVIRRRTRLSLSMEVQVAVIVAVFLLFVFSVVITRPGTTWTTAGKVVVAAAIAVLAIAGIGLAGCRHGRKCLREEFVLAVKRNRYLLLALCITAAVVYLHFDTPVAYDSDLYYGSFIIAMDNFNFSLPGFMDSFCIASKPMHGIAMLMAVGEALDPGTGRGVYIVNLVLLLIAQVCVYKTILTLFPKLSRTSSALLSLCFAFSAYVVTGVTYINPDFYSVVTFAIFVFLWLRKYKVMAAYFGFLMMCSKPNMIVAYLVMLLIRLIFEIKKKRFATLDWMLYTAPIAVYLFLYFGVDSLNRVGVAKPSDLDAVTVLGSRLLQYFAYGLVWLPEIAIIWAVIHSAKKRSIHIFGDEKQVLLFSVWVASMSQLLILIIGGNVLQPCPRYLAICAVKNVLLLAWAFDELPRFASLRRILIPAFTTLLAIQLFVTIDPTIIMTTACKYDGLHYLVCPPTKSVGNDLTFYNYEYAKDAKSGTAILNDLSAQEIENLYTEGRGNYKLAIGSSDVYAAYWDTERKCRTYIRNDNCIRLGSINVTNGLSPLREERLPQSTVILRSNAKSYLWSQLSGREGDEYGSFTVFKGVTDD